MNVGLAIVLVAAAAAAYLSIGNPSAAQSTTTRTVAVVQGTVTATVTGTGNIASASTATVDFAGSGGTLSNVYVKVGQRVGAGQPLARIDATSAKQSLQNAQAQLASVRASYDQTVAGGTDAQRQKDQLSVQSAQLGVTSAQNSLDAARQQYDSDKKAQDALVAAALAAANAGTGTNAAYQDALRTRAAVLSKDDQAITQAQQQLSSAGIQLQQARLTATADATPTAASLAQAKAQLTSAQIGVAQAQQAVDETLLTAPQAGTVMSIAATVGQTVSGGGSSASSSGSGSAAGGSGSSGSSGSSAGTGTSGSSSSSSTSGSGFIVLSDLATLTVTANIAEADAAAVKVGQGARVTLSATNTAVDGKVTAVSLESTTSNNVVQYPVTVTLQDAPDGVRLGATASVSITTGSAADALYVPSSAVTTLGTAHTVTVQRGGATTVVPVRIGLVGDRGTQILSGLSAGERVVMPTSTSNSTSNGFPRLGGLGGLGGGRG